MLEKSSKKKSRKHGPRKLSPHDYRLRAQRRFVGRGNHHPVLVSESRRLAKALARPMQSAPISARIADERAYIEGLDAHIAKLRGQIAQSLRLRITPEWEKRVTVYECGFLPWGEDTTYGRMLLNECIEERRVHVLALKMLENRGHYHA